LSLADSVVNRP